MYCPLVLLRNQKHKHVVLLHLPAQYGHEAILTDIYSKSNQMWRIHVNDNKFRDYLCSEDLGDCTDSDARRAQWIHACAFKGGHHNNKNRNKGNNPAGGFHCRLPCQQGPFEVCQIKPTAMYFTQERMKDKEDKIVHCVGANYYRVCYATHSSLTELKEFVEYFKPKKLIPCVVPEGMNARDVLAEFDQILKPDSLDLSNTQLTFESLGSFSPESSTSSTSVS